MATPPIVDDEISVLLTGFLLGLVNNADIPGLTARVEFIADQPILVFTFIDRHFSCIITPTSFHKGESDA